MLFFGGLLVFFTIIKHDVQMMQAYSWLPLVGLLILIVGIIESLEAYLSIHTDEFFLKLQNALLDLVVGFLVHFTVADPARLSLMITAFLIFKGLLRIIVSQVIELPNPSSTRMGGLISVAMGILIWFEWPSSEPWFLAFCLSTEVTLRGWAIVMFGLSLSPNESKATPSVD